MGRRFSWLGAASALASIVLIFVGFGIHGSFKAQEAKAEVAQYYASHADSARVWTGNYVEFLGYLMFAIFVAWLWSIMRNEDHEDAWARAAVLVGGTIYLALAATSFAAFDAALRRGGEIGPDAAAALSELGLFTYYLSWPAAAVAMMGAAVGVGRSRILPRWLAWAAAAVAVILVAAAPLRLVAIDSLLQLWGIAAGVAWARRARRVSPRV